MLKSISKYYILVTVVAFTCVLISCEQKSLFSDLNTCKKVEKYPSLYSYKTDSLMAALKAKATVALVDNQKDTYFTKDAFNDNSDYTKDLFYGGEFEVFPLNKIVYSNSTVVIYLVKEIEENSFPELDIISLVMYDNAGKPVYIINENLLNPFGTKEVKITSPTEFEVLWIDEEYSPDLESEAEDIENGYVHVPVLITTIYKIDTLELKFIQQNTWQEDHPFEKDITKQETDTESSTLEDPNQFCFESTSPNAMKATPLYEYLEITCIDDTIWGVGAGDFMADSQPWTLSFNGKLTEEKNMELSVTYNQEGEVPFATSEIWSLDLENERLYRKDWAKSKIQMGASEYHSIKCNEIPEDYTDQISKMKPVMDSVESNSSPNEMISQ